jgi:hypothetical protein
VIVCRERKIGIFLVPKTGTTTLYSLFKNIPVYHKDHSHTNYIQSNGNINIPDFCSYKFFAFYRDPIEKFVSCVDETLKLRKVDITVSQFISDCRDRMHILSVGYMPQTYWLDHKINLTLLDYAKFEKNIKYLMSLFDVHNIQIPKLNTAEHKRELNEQDRIDIREMYSTDYDFFERRGILL